MIRRILILTLLGIFLLSCGFIRHASAADSCSAPDDDSQPDQYSAASHRNASADNYLHARAEI